MNTTPAQIAAERLAAEQAAHADHLFALWLIECEQHSEYTDKARGLHRLYRSTMNAYLNAVCLAQAGAL